MKQDEPHLAADLEKLFNGLFTREQKTRLLGGCDEPLYRPAAGADQICMIYYTRDYFASALHEVAHWCVAGAVRRQQEDYGYWYAPDGRSQELQLVFEQVEIKPQALEWLFSAACGFRFRVSADNLALSGGPSAEFKQHISQQVHRYLSAGIPARAARFCNALAAFYGGNYLCPEQYNLEALS